MACASVAFPRGGSAAHTGTAQTRQGAQALIRYMQNPKNARAPKSGPLMAIMALLLPGGTAQG